MASTGEFDISDLTTQVTRIEEKLREADTINGSLLRVMKLTVNAWNHRCIDELIGEGLYAELSRMNAIVKEKLTVTEALKLHLPYETEDSTDE